MPVALLSGIADSFGVSHAKAGMLISVYAWMVMLLSLPLMVAVSRVALRKLMLWIMVFFVLFQFCSAISHSYGMLMLSRIGVACSHSIFWAIVPVVAVRIVPAEHKATALGMVVTGSSLAMILGLPLGRVIGLTMGWRMTFGCVGAFALVTFFFLARILPRVEKGEPFTLRRLPEMLTDRTLVCIYLLTLIFTVAYYSCYSYIEPFLLNVAEFTDRWATAALMLFGGAGIAGSVLFSKFYSRNPALFFGLSLIGLGGCMAAMLPASMSAAGMLVLLIIWGVSITAFNVSLQDLIIKKSPAWATTVSMATYSGIYNLGIGSGALIGGVVSDNLGITHIGPVGAMIALGGYAFWRMSVRRRIA